MSSSKTQRYQLHQWQPQDSVLRAEFNENFAALDAALGSLFVTGSYEGDGTASRLISLPFTPRAVILATSNGQTYRYPYTSGGIFCTGDPLIAEGGGSRSVAAEIVDGGFTVSFNNNTGAYTNWGSVRFYYAAFV